MELYKELKLISKEPHVAREPPQFANPCPKAVEAKQGRVLVTGAAGYIATHVIARLRQEGYRVRATIRGSDKRQLVTSLFPGIELFEADLTDDSNWDWAVEGCQDVVHVASPFPSRLPRHSAALIGPAVDGTQRVLRACLSHVRRVVITSCVDAIQSRRDDSPLTEKDWADIISAEVDDYSTGKAVAERAAWDFVSKHSPCFQLVSINPAMVLGPVLNDSFGTSVSIIKRCLDGSMLCYPNVNFAICDVRDVAEAHYRALVMSEAVGHRHIILSGNIWFRDIVDLLRAEFEPLGYRVPRCSASMPWLWALSRFDGWLRRFLPRMGKVYTFSNERMRNVLQIEPHDIRSSIIETAYSLIDHGVIKRSNIHKSLLIKNRRGVLLERPIRIAEVLLSPREYDGLEMVAAIHFLVDFDPRIHENKEAVEAKQGRVLVTGAAGYIATHVIARLRQEGYRVRATIRGSDKRQLVTSLFPGIELFEADLTDDSNWDWAVEGCQDVVHVASPFPSRLPRHSAALIGPAVDGTQRVLRACLSHVRRVVITSCVDAIQSRRDDSPLTEKDWADIISAEVDDYSTGKAVAERAAWDFVSKHSPCFQLVSINPAMVLGPVLNDSFGTSVSIIKRCLDGSMLCYPNVNFAICDVRDVAEAHYRALVMSEAVGHRHIILSGNIWFRDIVDLLRAEFEPLGYRVPRCSASMPWLWALSRFDGWLRRFLPRMGKVYTFSNERMRNVLQIEPHDIRSSIIETAYSLIDHGVIKRSNIHKSLLIKKSWMIHSS
ncbi:hypothetical protein LAZ67_6003997 [Cordylochernes scorpioides]|uniref:NAD-dependent epimerase/dehydratase domain-containing protein n=1 Tax=Cordylochernes scorpioides TaxID=51811 RepID=A0ABY6KMY9_9ARAC|nr:hypothetical protein LAZ67_6003997 [Cordylochernes scorpioides]